MVIPVAVVASVTFLWPHKIYKRSKIQLSRWLWRSMWLLLLLGATQIFSVVAASWPHGLVSEIAKATWGVICFIVFVLLFVGIDFRAK
jgi:hypothetical protein